MCDYSQIAFTYILSGYYKINKSFKFNYLYKYKVTLV